MYYLLITFHGQRKALQKMTNKKIVFRTYYNKIKFTFDCEILSKNKIEFEIDDRSNQLNFRVPQSAYFEADLLVNESDFDKVYKLLQAINNS